MNDDWTGQDYPTPSELKHKLYGIFRKCIVDRAFNRLSRSAPIQVNDNTWVVQGYPDLGDEYPDYRVTLQDNRYSCDCYKTRWGDTRKRRGCSHVVTVIAARKLQRGELRSPPHPPREGFPALYSTYRHMRSVGASVPSPRELGLPHKFESFRDVQVEAIQKILGTNKKWILLQAPTGSGKTLIAAAVQKLLKKNMIYTAHTKDLQDQFVRDFPYAVELKGRENYPTRNYAAAFPRINCGMCMKTFEDPRCRWCCDLKCYRESPCLETHHCNGRRECPYEMQKVRALNADVAVLNMAFFLNEANYVGEFGAKEVDGPSGEPKYQPTFHLLCLDEGDLTESGLMGFVQLEVTNRQISRLGLQPPKFKTKEEAWLEWAAAEALPKVTSRIAEIKERIDSSKKGDGDWAGIQVEELRELQELRRASIKLGFFCTEMQSTMWVNCSEDMENGPWVFKPVFVSRYAGKYIWRHADRFLIMSATIISKDQFCKNLGIPRDEAVLIDLPSTFPKENRPVFYVPCANMTEKTREEEWPKVADALDRVLDTHPNEKVLVHTVSYRLARYIAEMSRHEERLVIYDSASCRKDAIEFFKSSDKPLVILAPSMERGIDLPDDLCRVVVIVKTPYANPGDNQVRKRLYSAKDGRSWYSVDTVRTIVQMSGRGVRHDRDYCVTYILDSQFGRLYKLWRHVFPAWWREALEVKTLEQITRRER